MKQYADMSNPHKVKGAEALLLSLLAEGTDTLFGYPGGAVIPIYDEIRDSSIRHVLVRHEQCAAHAADGYARARSHGYTYSAADGHACAYAYSHAGTNCHTGTHCHAGTYGRTRQGKGRRPWADRGTIG